jgi:predicted glycosyltransferase
MMRILIDIGHPAHVHLFRNLYFELVAEGNFVIVSIKDIPIAKKLLDIYGIPYTVLGKKSDGLFGKFFDQLIFGFKVWRIVKRNRIEIAIGTSINIAHVSKFSKVTSFVFDDDDSEVQPLMVKFGHPYADYIISPNVLDYESNRENRITYPGYHELAYLHPKRFTPDKSVLTELGIDSTEKFFILRFNAFKAHHDVGVSGLSLEQKRRLVEYLLHFGRVVITTERDIDAEFLPYQIKVSPERAHSLLSFATVFIGDSQTMTSEAAVLGVPSLRCNSFAGRISYLEEEEKKYGLTYAYLPNDFESLMSRLESWMTESDLLSKWKDKRQAMLNDKIDVTLFFKTMLYDFSRDGKIKKQQWDFNLFKK